MNPGRFAEVTGRYPGLRVAVVGDYFLDRYLLIDPSRAETSIETGLPVHNVVAVRSQPGAAGTIVNNLVALGVGEIRAVGFSGDDGEGYELRKALASQGVLLDDFPVVLDRRTPVYCKPLIVEEGQEPRELSRLDSKNWTATPEVLARDLAARLVRLADRVDAIILMDQVDLAGTGVVTRPVLEAARVVSALRPDLLVIADSRRGLGDYPPVGLKMNAAELARMKGPDRPDRSESTLVTAGRIADDRGRPVFVTLAERGIFGAWPGCEPEHVAAFPVLGPIDVVGAGDSVTANLAAALAAGAGVREAMEMAMAAASIVVHQLGTTGTADIEGIGRRLLGSTTRSGH